MITEIEAIKRITYRIHMSIFGVLFNLRVEHDNKYPNGRIFLQVTYNASCNKTGETLEWHGRKWYLSDHMTKDEIIKTAWCAFEAAVKHEIMEGFKVDGKVLFNPHVDFESLLSISDHEIKRDPKI